MGMGMGIAPCPPCMSLGGMDPADADAAGDSFEVNRLGSSSNGVIGARGFAGSVADEGAGRSLPAQATRHEPRVASSRALMSSWTPTPADARAPVCLHRDGPTRPAPIRSVTAGITAAVTGPRHETATMNRSFFFALHRWVSLLTLGQLAVWLGSGLFFASFPMSEVHGVHVESTEALTPDDGAALLSPAIVIGMVEQTGFGSVDALELRRAFFGPVYVARGAHHTSLRVDARNGNVVTVTREEAERAAQSDRGGDPAVVESALVERDAPIEYRDKPLPAWRVVLADGSGTAVWVDAHTAEVTARRNDRWRQYDFLWSLHIMDYRGRESFHHPLLIAAACLGILTVLSGATLWILRLLRWARQRRITGRTRALRSR